jgi:hypothetical protein
MAAVLLALYEPPVIPASGPVWTGRHANGPSAMIHPLFRLIASHPQLVTDHVEAYTDLMAEDIGAATAALKRRMVLLAVSLCGAVAAAGLAGTAVLLWAALPEDSIHAPWALWVVPAIPAVVALWAALGAQAGKGAGSFQSVRSQLAADAAMLREVSAS